MNGVSRPGGRSHRGCRCLFKLGRPYRGQAAAPTGDYRYVVGATASSRFFGRDLRLEEVGELDEKLLAVSAQVIGPD